MTKAVAKTAGKKDLQTTSEPGITLLLNESDIDQPNFPVQWKFSPEMLERIQVGLFKGYGYAVLMVAQKEDDWHYHFEQRAVNEYRQFVRLLEVPRPGNWTIGVLLFERTSLAAGQRTTDVLCRDINSEFCSIEHKWKYAESRRKYSRITGVLTDLPTQEGFGYQVFPHDWSETGVLIAKDVVTAHVKVDVFPEEPPEWLTTFGNYFFGGRMPYDQCNFVWRVAGMVFPGSIPWFLIESAKRVGLFVAAMAMLLFGFVDWWKLGDRALEGSANVALMVEGVSHEKVDFLDGHYYRQFLAPGFLLIYAGLFKVLSLGWHWTASVLSSVHFPSAHLPDDLSPLIYWILGFVALVGLVHLNRNKIATALGNWWEAGEPKREAAQAKREVVRRERTLAEGAADANIVAAFAPVLTSSTPIEVSVDAVPKALRPKGFTWLSLFKRDHCSPWRYGH